jgi:hypothetical protein
VGAIDNAPGPWNPGVLSQVPKEWRPLATIFRPENVYGDLAAAEELSGLTGFGLSELVVFRPQRLVLHELLIRVTADFTVPDGSRIEDLGINFRRMAGLFLTRYLEPEMEAIAQTFEKTRRDLTAAFEAALSTVGLSGVVPSRVERGAAVTARKSALLAWLRKSAPAATPRLTSDWGTDRIADCRRRAEDADGAVSRIVFGTLARVLSGLFGTHGRAWGTRELIVTVARDMACNVLGSDAIGRLIEPLLHQAARQEGFELLPPQDRPIVINTKGASASGKSTLRPLQKKLAGDIGAKWSDFALISPDIWRKQLLDYRALGAAYKYAGAFTAQELQIIDQKLDRYMAQKFARGNMSHLLIDRFRFDSFAPDSDEEGSNLLTRFGQTVYLFFVITPPELLVERAWKRGLDVGRYKAVDDTLAHSVEAYTGIPNVFFTWVRRSDKRIQFEFLDNTVPLGQRPRTVAFGDNDAINVLDVKRMVDIVRFGRVAIDAASPDTLYRDRGLLAAERNLDFLTRCMREFRRVNFAAQASGRIYLRFESGTPTLVDPEPLRAALNDADTRVALQTAARGALSGSVAEAGRPQYLRRYQSPQAAQLTDEALRLTASPTLGVWGEAAPPA